MTDFQMPDAERARIPADAECCRIFLKHLSLRRLDISDAIFKAAADTGFSAEYVSRALVEMGLRASSSCFPADFVRRLQDRRDIPLWSVAALTRAQHALLALWSHEDMIVASGARYGHLTLVHAA